MVAILAGLMLVAVSPAQAKGPRVTIGVYGDSVVEGYTIQHYLTLSLVPRLGPAIARAGGFELGATGLVPATPFRWTFNKYTVVGRQAPRPNAWVLAGFASFGNDGPSGYSAVTSSPTATATAPVDGPDVGILFTKFAGAGVFTVTAGTQTFQIDASSIGPPQPTEQWITVPPGVRKITVHGPQSGTLVFAGAVVRKPVTDGRIGVEVENLGHAGQELTQYSSPRVLTSLLQQRFDISVFLAGYLYELLAEGGSSNKLAARYNSELRSRVGLVRSYGGMCLIADPSPLSISASLVARFAAIDRQVAKEEGCAYTPALSHLWDPFKAARTGLTLIDSIHPTSAGYRLMANALAPVLARLVRERVRTRGF